MQANGVLPNDGDWMLGCNVTILTTLGEEVSGTIFTFDRLTNLLVVSEEASPGCFSYRFLKADCIKEIAAADAPTQPIEPPLEFIRLDDCLRREQEAVQAIELRHAPRVEVIEAGQKLFSKISEGYDCKWEGRTINVEDKVFVDEPYTIVDFRSTDEHEDLREMLKLTVDEEG